MPKWAVLSKAGIWDEARKRLAKARRIADPEWDSRDNSAHTHMHRESRHDFDFEAFIPASVISKVM